MAKCLESKFEVAKNVRDVENANQEESHAGGKFYTGPTSRWCSEPTSVVWRHVDSVVFACFPPLITTTTLILIVFLAQFKTQLGGNLVSGYFPRLFTVSVPVNLD